ncbi:4758_t:CDS:2, partial [Dentiscutata erythropus]
NDGTAYLIDCPIGLQFNPISSRCDWPHNLPESAEFKIEIDYTLSSDDPARLKVLGFLNFGIDIYRNANIISSESFDSEPEPTHGSETIG